MSRLTKMWNPKWDDRQLLKGAMNGALESDVDMFLKAFFAVVFSKTETNFVGFAKFEWTPVRGRTPTGEEFVSRRLKVTPSRYAHTPAKNAPVLGAVSALAEGETR